MKQHIIKTCKTAYTEIRRISSIRQYLTEDASKTLVNSCILSRLDYFNHFNKFRTLQLNSSLNLVEQNTPNLFSSNCTGSRIKYKIDCLCYQIITGTAPQYLAELVQIYVPSRSLRSSSDDRIFRIPFFKRKQHGGLSASLLFKSGILFLSLSVSSSLPACKTSLKTYLFKQYFDQ